MRPEAYEELDRLETTHWWFRGMRTITAQLLPESLTQRTDLHILDAGCGVGGNLRAFAPLGRAEGIDYSLHALRYACREHAGRLCRATVEALPYADEIFDLITSFDVLSNAGVRQDGRALCEFARVLRPGGYLLLRVAALAGLRGAHDIYIDNARRYTQAALLPLLTEAGLTPVRMTYANTVLLPVIFVVRKMQLLKLRLTGSTPGTDINPAPGPFNALLTAILNQEGRWIGRGHSLPAGVSLYGLARKPLNKQSVGM